MRPTADQASKTFFEKLSDLGNQPIIADGATHVGDKQISYLTRMRGKLAEIPSEHKVEAGISLICAVLSTVGAINSARHSVTKDSDGQSHVQWSQVGFSLMQAGIAAGLAYMGAQTLRSGVAR